MSLLITTGKLKEYAKKGIISGSIADLGGVYMIRRMDTRIILLDDPSSPYISRIHSIQKELVPEYTDWDPYNMARIRTDEKGRPCAEIYMGFCDSVLAGFMRVRYIYY